MTVHDQVDADFDSMVEDIRGVLRHRSVLEEDKMTKEDPFGHDLTVALDDFLDRAKRLGFATKNLDNMVGYAEFGEGKQMIGMLAHLDVVPEGRLSEWKKPPYAGDADGENIYGRGSYDDKGPAVSCLYAMKALRDSGVKINSRFRLIVGLDEETGSRCMKHYNEVEEQPTYSFSPDADFPVVNAEKGRLLIEFKNHPVNKFSVDKARARLVSFEGGTRVNVVPDETIAVLENVPATELERIKKIFASYESCELDVKGDKVTIVMKGLAAHAMEPWKGKNALLQLLEGLSKVVFDPLDLHEYIVELSSVLKRDVKGESLGIAQEDAVSGPLTCNASIVSLKDGVLSVKCDIRYPVTADCESIVHNLEMAAREIKSEMTVLAQGDPLYVPEDSELVQKLLEAYEAVTGEKGRAISTGGGTYCRTMPNAVSFGAAFPGQPDRAHQANEFMGLAELRKMTHLYAEALLRFNG